MVCFKLKDGVIDNKENVFDHLPCLLKVNDDKYFRKDEKEPTAMDLLLIWYP